MNWVDISEIEGVVFSHIHEFQDVRGVFLKTTPLRILKSSLDSIALSFNPKAGTIRGIHFQTGEFAEEKLVSCVQGSSFEVIIDLRPLSSTLGKGAIFELSEANRLQVFLPKGIAHGFQTLSPNTITQYCLTSQYLPNVSFTINPIRDQNINWPIKDYLVSKRDLAGLTLEEAINKYSNSMAK